MKLGLLAVVMLLAVVVMWLIMSMMSEKEEWKWTEDTKDKRRYGEEAGNAQKPREKKSGR